MVASTPPPPHKPAPPRTPDRAPRRRPLERQLSENLKLSKAAKLYGISVRTLKLLLAALCMVCAACAATLLIGQPNGALAATSNELHRQHWPYIRHALSRRNIATTVQAIGALITACGLAHAYTRAKNNQTPTQWLRAEAKKTWNKTLRRTPPPRRHTGSGHGTITSLTTASGRLVHTVDITQSLHEQIKRLATFVNNRTRDAAKLETKVAGIEHELRKIRDESSQLEARMWAQIEARIQDLNDRLDRVQVLDLTLAIRGLVISLAGTLWSLGT